MLERAQPRFNLAEAIQSQMEQPAAQNFCVPLKPLLGFEGYRCENTGLRVRFRPGRGHDLLYIFF